MTTRPSEPSESQTWRRMVRRLAPHDRASWAVQSQLTARGVSTLRLPRATVLGSKDGTPVPELVFKGSEAAGTTLAGASLAAHAGTVDAHLKRNNFPVPQGREYTSRQVTRAKKYARRIGYPVVMRPANSARANGIRIVASTEAELVRGFAHIQDKTQGRVVLQEKKSPRSAWVQKLPEGKVLRMFVVGRQVVGVAEVSADGTDHETVPLGSMRPDYLRAGVESLRVLPGLEHGEVELLVPADGERYRHLSYFVMHIRPTPPFDVYRLMEEPGKHVLDAYTQYYLSKSGISATEARSKRHVKVSYAGVVKVDRFTEIVASAFAAEGYTKDSFDLEHQGDDWISLETEETPEMSALLALAAFGGASQEEHASKAVITVLD